MPNSAWTKALETDVVQVLPLVDDIEPRHAPGWCTYESSLAGIPEIEFISGGINTKTPAAVGLWRQGNLLHFGFEQSPDEMNDTGDALLVNSIAYIARFTEDRPNVRSPSPFVDTTVVRPRTSLLSYLKRGRAEWFVDAIDASILPDDRSAESLETWFEANRAHLRPDGTGKLTIDEEARSLGIAYDEPTFFTEAIAALRDPRAARGGAHAARTVRPGRTPGRRRRGLAGLARGSSPVPVLFRDRSVPLVRRHARQVAGRAERSAPRTGTSGRTGRRVRGAATRPRV